MNQCPKCQEPLKEGVAFCTACGEKVRERSGMTPSPLIGTPRPAPAERKAVAGRPRGPVPPPRNNNQQQLYTVLAFLFIAITLGFGVWKIRAWQANRSETEKIRVKEVIREVPVPVNGGTGESAEARQKRELEAKRKEEEHQAELKRLMAQADASERQRLMAIEQQRIEKEKAEEIGRRNAQLEAQREDSRKRAAEASAETARIEAARQKATIEAEEARKAQAAADLAARRAQEEAEAIRREQQRKLEQERMRVPVYNGPNRGTIVWSGIVRPGMEVQIDGNTCNVGQLTGGLPGVLVQVDTPPELHSKVQIVNTPSVMNGYKLISFRILRGSGPLTVTLNWNRP